MYKTDCLGIIAPAMRRDLTVFRRGFMFAICSIRQATINVPDQLAVLFDGAEDENPLFGSKFAAWAYISDEAKASQLWRDVLACDTQRRKGAVEAISNLLRVPGLGIVKAAFIAQLMGFNVACLDARNIAREKRNPRAFRTDGKSPEALRPKVIAYVQETWGKAARYWDAWCNDVAAAYDPTPQQISDLHLAIVPDDFVPF
jgi:hypothetical protein